MRTRRSGHGRLGDDDSAAGGPTWDIESARPNISWWGVVLTIRQHGCDW